MNQFKAPRITRITSMFMDVNKLIYDAIGASFEVYNALGPGLLEGVYEKALIHELKLRGLRVSSQVPVEIVYKGETVGADLRLDIIVNDTLIIELKSVESLMPVHFKQVRTYMKLLDKPAGLLVNFDVSDFKNGYKVIK